MPEYFQEYQNTQNNSEKDDQHNDEIKYLQEVLAENKRSYEVTIDDLNKEKYGLNKKILCIKQINKTQKTQITNLQSSLDEEQVKNVELRRKLQNEVN